MCPCRPAALLLTLLLTLLHGAAEPPAAPPEPEATVVLLAGEAARDPAVLEVLRGLAAADAADAGAAVVLAAGPPDAPLPFPPELTGAARVVRLAPGIDAERGRPIAESLDLAAAVDGAPLLLLCGGEWLDWWSALRPAGKASPLERALERALETGRAVAAHGGARAFLAPFLLERERLDRPVRNPRRRHADVVVTGPVLASQLVTLDAAEGALRRLLHPDLPRFWVERSVLVGDVAWVLGARDRPARVLGSGAVLVLEVREPGDARGRDGRVRLSILRAGDGWDGGPGPAARERPAAAPPAEVAREGVVVRRVEDALDAATLVAEAGAAFCAESRRALLLLDERTTVELECASAAPCTRDGRSGGGLFRLRLRIDREPPAELPEPWPPLPRDR